MLDPGSIVFTDPTVGGKLTTMQPTGVYYFPTTPAAQPTDWMTIEIVVLLVVVLAYYFMQSGK